LPGGIDHPARAERERQHPGLDVHELQAYTLPEGHVQAVAVHFGQLLGAAELERQPEHVGHAQQGHGPAQRGHAGDESPQAQAAAQHQQRPASGHGQAKAQRALEAKVGRQRGGQGGVGPWRKAHGGAKQQQGSEFGGAHGELQGGLVGGVGSM